jgi:hypothetical protein
MMDEDELHRMACELLDSLGWRYCHCPNGGYRRTAEAKKFTALGVKPGVPDLLIFERYQWEHSTGSGIAIELKSPTGKGRVSPEQEAWLAALDARGWLVSVCQTWEQVLRVLQRCRPLNGRRMP